MVEITKGELSYSLPTVRNMTNAVNMELYDFLNDIPETRRLRVS